MTGTSHHTGSRAVRRGFAAGFALLLFLLGACNGGDDGASTTDRTEAGSTDQTDESSTTTSSVKPTTTLSEDERVLAAYKAALDAYFKALDPPNPNLPALLSTHTGTALDLAQSVANQIASQNAVGRGPYQSHPKLVSRTETDAIVDDCLVDGGHLFDAATGERLDLNEPDTSNNHYKNHMVLETGTWKLEEAQDATAAEPCTPS